MSVAIDIDSLVLAAQPRVAQAIAPAGSGDGAHALMLAGAPGYGTRAAARWLARARLCPAGGCDSCDVCGRVDRRSHPDLHWLVAEGVDYTIDAIRELVRTLRKSPFEGAAHVVVLEDADTLSAANHEAGNSLLTILEEPPAPTLFVLMCERPALLLPTLRSRSVVVQVPALDPSALAETLQAAGVSPATLAPLGMTMDSLVRMARGDADRALGLACAGPELARYRAAMQVAAGLASGQLLPASAVDMLLTTIDDAASIAEAQASREFGRMLELMAASEASSFQSKSNPQGIEQRTRRRVRRARTHALRLVMADLAAFHRDLIAVACGSSELIACHDQLPVLTSLAHAPTAQRAVAALDAIAEVPLRADVNNADITLMLASLCAELAAIAGGRVRVRRTMGAGSITPQGVDLALG